MPKYARELRLCTIRKIREYHILRYLSREGEDYHQWLPDIQDHLHERKSAGFVYIAHHRLHKILAKLVRDGFLEMYYFKQEGSKAKNAYRISPDLMPDKIEEVLTKLKEEIINELP